MYLICDVSGWSKKGRGLENGGILVEEIDLEGSSKSRKMSFELANQTAQLCSYVNGTLRVFVVHVPHKCLAAPSLFYDQYFIMYYCCCPLTGLKRNGKSCRLRWVNYLRPDLKRGQITPQEESIILELHARWGNR